MPRFNPDQWTPRDDSSEGYRTLDPDCVVLNVGFRQDAPGYSTVGCPCGCGDFPLGDQATFCMGHDARLRGILIRAHLMDVRIRYHMDGTLGSPITALTAADLYAWKSYLEAAVIKRDSANKDVVRRSMGREDLIEIGKWPPTGQVAAIYRTRNEKVHEIEYVNQAGDIRKMRMTRVEQEATP